jgi:hypothetical protein
MALALALATWRPLCCPHCGSQRHAHNGRKGPQVTYRRCRACGMTFLAMAEVPVEAQPAKARRPAHRSSRSAAG